MAAAGSDPVDAVEAAMLDVDRRGFLPRRLRRRAGEVRPLPIGHGQTNSQPRTVAATLRLLVVSAGQHVLDVGAGSGWTTALIARLVGPRGSVVGVELEPDLAAWGAANLADAARAAGTPWGSARIETARKGVLGWPAEAPYDRILVSASAQRLPTELLDQLSPGGSMVCVVGSQLPRDRHGDDGSPATTEHGYYTFVAQRGSAGRFSCNPSSGLRIASRCTGISGALVKIE
jgi:protein-L-isoaspartate(D-aspartate) O-methyltransferase